MPKPCFDKRWSQCWYSRWSSRHGGKVAAGMMDEERLQEEERMEEEGREGDLLAAIFLLDPGGWRDSPRAWHELSGELSHLEDGGGRS